MEQYLRRPISCRQPQERHPLAPAAETTVRPFPSLLAERLTIFLVLSGTRFPFATLLTPAQGRDRVHTSIIQHMPDSAKSQPIISLPHTLCIVLRNRLCAALYTGPAVAAVQTMPQVLIIGSRVCSEDQPHRINEAMMWVYFKLFLMFSN